MKATIIAKWYALPRPIRSFLVDAVEGSVVAVAVLNLALPRTTTEAVAQTTLVIGAIGSPLVAAFRRDILPALLSFWAQVRESTEQ